MVKREVEPIWVESPLSPGFTETDFEQLDQTLKPFLSDQVHSSASSEKQPIDTQPIDKQPIDTQPKEATDAPNTETASQLVRFVNEASICSGSPYYEPINNKWPPYGFEEEYVPRKIDPLMREERCPHGTKLPVHVHRMKFEKNELVTAEVLVMCGQCPAPKPIDYVKYRK
jgi:hypothetical protein